MITLILQGFSRNSWNCKNLFFCSHVRSHNNHHTMQFLHLPEALTLGINKHFAWAQIQTAMLDLDQLRALTGNNQEKALCREWLQQKEEEKVTDPALR